MPATIETIKSTIITITTIFLVEDFIGYIDSLRSLEDIATFEFVLYEFITKILEF